MDHSDEPFSSAPPRNHKFGLLLGIFGILVLLGCIFGIVWLAQAPATDTVFEVRSGMSVSAIADAAEEAGIVRSGLLLYIVLTQMHDPSIVQAGTYRFHDTHSVFSVASKLAHSKTDKSLLSVTIPEGTTATQTAAIVSQHIPDFDTKQYLLATQELEGYLFPETYFVPKDFTPKDFIDFQLETFKQQTSDLQEQIEQSAFSEYEILILASILEREANDEQSMRMVSGILQNRLDIGMALQADATIGYILEKPLSELQSSDLEIDSPYNTYLYPGLTPTPIGNPGLVAIQAVLDPIESNYFYYITADDGTFYYAETFAQHKQNIQKYLR